MSFRVRQPTRCSAKACRGSQIAKAREARKGGVGQLLQLVVEKIPAFWYQGVRAVVVAEGKAVVAEGKCPRKKALAGWCLEHNFRQLWTYS